MISTVRDPQVSYAIRGVVIEQLEELLSRMKELESELRMFLDNLESRRRDRHGPSTSGDDPIEDGSEEDNSTTRTLYRVTTSYRFIAAYRFQQGTASRLYRFRTR